jgi:hypothetical protein
LIFCILSEGEIEARKFGDENERQKTTALTMGERGKGRGRIFNVPANKRRSM